MARIRSIRTGAPDPFSYVVGRRDDKGAKIVNITKERGGYKVKTQGGGDIFIRAGDVVEVN